jgi:hypothetical protein
MESIHVSLCGSTFDTFLTVVDPQGNVLAFNDDSDNCGTSSELTFDPQGQGLVYVIVEGWGNEVGAFDIAIDANYLGTHDNEEENVHIYPNPATENITLQGIQGNVEFTTITGSTVKRIPTYSGEKISLIGLNEGVYFVHFEKSGLSYSEKIVIR